MLSRVLFNMNGRVEERKTKHCELRKGEVKMKSKLTMFQKTKKPCRPRLGKERRLRVS